MLRYIIIFAAIAISACSSPPDTGGYGQAYTGKVTGLKRTQNVTVYVARSQAQAKDLENQFLHKSNKWQVIGTASLFGQYCDTAKIQEVGRTNGADVACVYIAAIESFKQKVAYYGDYPYNPNYYGTGYGYNPAVQPYQVAPPEGGLIDSQMRVHEYNRRVRQENETRQIENAKWGQVVVYFRRITEQ